MDHQTKQQSRRDGGFTLTELAVAMLIMGILAAIAVPSFLGARDNAYDREAQAAVDAALDAATMHYANYGDFGRSDTVACGDANDTILPDDLQRLEPNFDFVDDFEESNSPREISVDAAETWNADEENLGCQAFYAVALSRSGICWVGRITVEGMYLATGGESPIVVDSDESTANTVIQEQDQLQVNGRAYGAIKVNSKAADGGTGAGGVDLSAAQGLCDANSQAGLVGGVTPDEFYDGWRTVVNSENGYDEVPA